MMSSQSQPLKVVIASTMKLIGIDAVLVLLFASCGGVNISSSCIDLDSECITITTLAETFQNYAHSEVTVLFLPANHVLNNHLRVGNVSSLSISALTSKLSPDLVCNGTSIHVRE